MSTHYFAPDGSYGDATDIVIVHTDNWTSKDWDEIMDSSDDSRIHIARQIADSKSGRNFLLLGL